MTENRKFGWRPDIPDMRDFKYSAVMQAVDLPTKVDLRPLCPPIEDQGNLGSCTANAGVGLLEFVDIKKDRKYINLSRLFVYYNVRLLEGNVGYDAGGTIRSALKAMYKYGACSEARLPYNTTKYKKKPTATRYKEALKYKIPGYYRMKNLPEVKTSLAKGVPVLFGFAVYESFMSEEVKRTGVAELPKEGEAPIGGHAVLAVGYDDEKKVLIVRNSWSKFWGDKGYFYMPYDYISKGIALDFWTTL